MELKQLRNFLTVAEELHFGHAAKRLHISQPALSFDIRKFEEQLNVSLFIRTNKRVSLTAAGHQLLKEAPSLLNKAKELERLVRLSEQGTVGQLRIGYVNSMIFRGLPEAVARFEASYPKVEIVLREMNSQEQLTALGQRYIDIGCAHSAHHPTDIVSTTLLAEPFVCCLPESHPLAKEPVIAVNKLAAEPFICFPRTVSPHYHDNIIAICIRAGFSPWIRHETRLWQTIIAMVEHNMGIALVPRSLGAHFFPAVKFIPLTGEDYLSSLLLLKRNEQESAAIGHFIDIVTQQVKRKSQQALAPADHNKRD